MWLLIHVLPHVISYPCTYPDKSGRIFYNRVPKCGSRSFMVVYNTLRTLNGFVFKSSSIYGSFYLPHVSDQVNMSQDVCFAMFFFSVSVHKQCVSLNKYVAHHWWNKWGFMLYLPLVCPVPNKLWLSDSIWRHQRGSPSTQVMAWCLKAQSHYLNQCWFVISMVHWHTSEGDFTWYTQAINR